MKRILALLVALSLLVSFTCVAFASNEPTYTITDVEYNGNYVSGRLVLTSGQHTPGLNRFVRVTFFCAGNNYMATKAMVDETGYFEATGVGIIEAISILAFGAARVSSPDMTRYDSYLMVL